MNKAPSLPPVVCLMGPTACGKTAVAVELVQRHPFEIVSVDSALVYKGLDIGSGKPDRATQKLAPHRLIDIRDPADPYSAADFRTDALREIADIHAKGKIPLLVGGTMLYFKVLRDGLATMPAANPEIRQSIVNLALAQGWEAVHRRLQEVDPVAATRIHPNDPQRLQRALEIYEMTGKPMSELHQEDAQSLRSTLPFKLHFLAMIPRERAKLHQLIAQRFQTMLDTGLVEEVRHLRARSDLNASLPAIRSVGYRQVWEFIGGECGHNIMCEKAIAATRQLAKRQLTWLRSWPDLCSIECNLVKEDVNIVDNCLKNMDGITIY